MKKSFALLALVPFVLFSCQKEVAQNDIDTVVPTLDNGIPTVITCDINQEATRTQYAGNQTFGWTNGDTFRMPVAQKNGQGEWTGCDFYTFALKESITDGAPSAKFYRNTTSTIAGGEEVGDFVSPTNDWYSLGYLVYPSSLVDSKERSGDYPIVNLRASYTYSASGPLNSATGISVPMIGRVTGSTASFYTAVGFIKVTLNSMSAATAKVVLESANNSISGKFAISDVPGSTIVAQIHKSSATAAATAATKKITLDVSSIAVGSNHDFYFPLPVGTYAANDFTIKVLDSSDKVLSSKTASKELTIARNEILELPAITVHSFGVTVSGAANAPYGNFTKQNSTIFFTVTDSEETLARASYIGGMKFSNSGTTPYDLHAYNTGLKDSPSGLKYLHYVVVPYTYKDSTCVNVPEDAILEQDKIPFYYLASADSAAIAGTYKFQSLYCLAAFDRKEWRDLTESTDNRLVLEVSDDATKGSVMITDYMGFQHNGTVTNVNLTNSNGTSLFGLNHNPNADSHLTKSYIDPALISAGSPVYGWYKASENRIYFDNTASQTLFNYNGYGFTLRNGYKHHSGFSFNFNGSVTPVTITYGSSQPIALVPSDASTENGNFDGSTPMIYPTKDKSNGDIVGERQ